MWDLHKGDCYQLPHSNSEESSFSSAQVHHAAGEDIPDAGAALVLMSDTHMSTDSHRDTGTVTVTWQPHNLPLETHHMQLLYTELVCFKPF